MTAIAFYSKLLSTTNINIFIYHSDEKIYTQSFNKKNPYSSLILFVSLEHFYKNKLVINPFNFLDSTKQDKDHILNVVFVWFM